MTVAVGIGCRRGAGADAIVTLVRDTLARAGLPCADAALFTIDAKVDEPGLRQAATDLGFALHVFPHPVLAAIDTPTQSRHAQAHLGLSCLAESAALAGAGPGSRLLMPRVARDGVTCAIAQGAS